MPYQFRGQYGHNSHVGFDDQGGHDSYVGFEASIVTIAKTVTMAITGFLLQNKLEKTFLYLRQYKLLRGSATRAHWYQRSSYQPGRYSRHPMYSPVTCWHSGHCSFARWTVVFDYAFEVSIT